MSEILFFASLACLILLIFLLSLILRSIDNDCAEYARESAKESEATDYKKEYIEGETLASAIADAIHTYRRERQSDERHRSKREKINIVVLGLTAIIALGAVFAAIYSAWIFSGQLAEMQAAGVDTRKMANAAAAQADSATKSLMISNRAWLIADNIAFRDVNNSNDPLAVHLEINNVGKSPATQTKPWINTASAFTPEGPLIFWHDLPVWNDSAFNAHNICKDIPDQRGFLIAPNTQLRNFGDIPTNRRHIPVDEVVKGRRFFIILGCFVYKTLDVIKHTAFCHYVKPPISNGVFSQCPVGNEDY